eukprot:TRINITY_DN24996_c0_g1_i1.p1 TRINITY_DN24996_c0_g1~~TRINITY_DN24996_c0_g1_i1.p1  ORF type:complete len:5363 (+),score=854.82 TRINITY_DN24996_c0_g1_i1:99-16091(+)
MRSLCLLVFASWLQVTSSELLALSVSSSSPGALDIVWGSAAAGLGSPGAEETTCAELAGWSVSVTDAGTTPIQIAVEESCDLSVPLAAGDSCHLAALKTNHFYQVEVAENCSNAEVNISASALVRTNPLPADQPRNFTLLDAGYTYLHFEWEDGAADNDCIFQSWEVQWRAYESSSELSLGVVGLPWSKVILMQHETSFNVTGLQENAPYDIRVRQVCTDPLANSAWRESGSRSSTYAWFTLPGIFEVHIGRRSSTTTLELSHPPWRCKVQKECCGDQFSVCYGASLDSETPGLRRTVTISRMEVPGGWGQNLKMQCTALAVQPWATFEEVQAPAPLFLEFYEPTPSTLKVRYELGYIIDEVSTCDCAGISLELRENGTDTWVAFPGRDNSCTLAGTTGCELIDAYPDKMYWARLKMTCENSSVDSEYHYLSDHIITPPGCPWSTHTGQWGYGDSYECADGTITTDDQFGCRTTGPLAVDRGGRLRCPAHVPIMCNNQNDCANSLDRCCKKLAEDCDDHGGVRICEVPAKEPVLVQVESLGPAALTVAWKAQQYLSGGSDCSFMEWRVAYSEVMEYGESAWTLYDPCRSVYPEITSCVIENLLSMTDYNVRVWAQCTVSELSSYRVRTSVAVETRPIPADEPEAIFCGFIEPLRFWSDWWESHPRDCTFQAWEMQAKLLARAEGYSEEGLFERAEPAGPWETKCLTYSRDKKDCWVENLLANRDYKIRVRETCTDPYANSIYHTKYHECRTLTMPAFDPENLTVSMPNIYTFRVDWDPGDPKACVFLYWEVQVKVNGTEWPEGDDPPIFGCRVSTREITYCTIHVGLGSGIDYSIRLREACTVRRLYTQWVYLPEPSVATRLPVRAPLPMNLTAFSHTPTHFVRTASFETNWESDDPGECIFTGWLVETTIHGREPPDWKEMLQCRENSRRPYNCMITEDLRTNTYYDMRITETCVDPNAISDTLTVYNIARTRPVPATQPRFSRIWATSARSLGVRFRPGRANECIFKEWLMEWRLREFDEGVWVRDDPCTTRYAPFCQVDGFPQSQSYYTLRMMETCTDPMADSQWREWRGRDGELLYALTWPEPAQPPENVTIVDITAYNLTFAFDPGDGLDCTWSWWQAELTEGHGVEPLSSSWTLLTECEEQFSTRGNVTCSVRGLKSFWPYQIRVRERCTSFIYDSHWGYSDEFMTTMPIPAGAPQEIEVVEKSVTAFFFDVKWKAGSTGQCIFKSWVMEVWQNLPEPGEWALAPLVTLNNDPEIWVEHACPAGREGPVCRPGDLPRSLKQDTSYRIRLKEICTDPNADGPWAYLEENVTTLIALIPATAPENLTISNDTAYTFLLQFDAGLPNDCYFTGWDVEVRENWTDPDNETNLTEFWDQYNYTLWVPREECKEEAAFPRHHMRCIVPRLRKHSIYDARVRESCYDGYTTALDSNFSVELADRQAETLVPVAATTPYGMYASDPGPYSFTVTWTPGDIQDCLYKIWLVEINAENYTGGEWREAIECGRDPRQISRCTITYLDRGYLGEESHIMSNTEYEVRVKEVCETYTSIYFPWGGSRERAEYLDSPTYYLPADMLPRTLIPIPTLTPLDFTISEVDHESFRLTWTPQVSNDCRFRNWTVEVKLVTHCVSGPGYVNCTDVPDQPWEISPSCVLKERSINTCVVYNMQSYSFYDVKMRERCSDRTAESDDARLVAEIWPFPADIPENMTFAPMIQWRSDIEPFTLSVSWNPGHPRECVFSHWDVQVQGRRLGDLDDRFSRQSVFDKWYGEILDLELNASLLSWSSTVPECRLEGQREVASCNITNLVSNAIYDVRIRERCVDSRADSGYLVTREVATIPAWALMAIGPNITNITTTEFYLEWAANEPRDCIFHHWKVELKPISVLDWIPVPECSLPDRSAVSCTVVGLQSYTNYDIRIQEVCRHETADSPYLLLEDAFKTEVGDVVYIGSNPFSNAKVYYYGARGLNSCAYHTKCCADEFSLCYRNASIKANKTLPSGRQELVWAEEVEIIRTDMTNAGWGQDLYLSCIAETVSIQQMKRVIARPPAKLEAVHRTARTITLEWLPYGTGGYLSDCYCSVWDIELRRKGDPTWLLSPDCNNMPFAQSSCTVEFLEQNWIFPNTIYEIRLRQTCGYEHLSSPYRVIEVPTLPGCTFSQHSNLTDFFICNDGSLSNIYWGGPDALGGDGTGCWTRGGRATCSKLFPYMCQSPDSCAKVRSELQGEGTENYKKADHCCMAQPCGVFNGGDRVCIVRPNAPVNIVATSPDPESLLIDWEEMPFADSTFYPCTFKRWQVDLSRFWYSHWSSPYDPVEDMALPEGCVFEDRTMTKCLVKGLAHNAKYYIRIREVCTDVELNGDWGSYVSADGDPLAPVNPLPAEKAYDIVPAERQPFLVNVTWSPGNLNDCIWNHWRVVLSAGQEEHVATVHWHNRTREQSWAVMSDLTDSMQYDVHVYEVCNNSLADSEVGVASLTTRPSPALAPLDPYVKEAGPYFLALEWIPSGQSSCEFYRWDVQLRRKGTDFWSEAVVCDEVKEAYPGCNITGIFDCYEDKTYTGFYDVCIPGVACPMLNVPSAQDCKLACEREPLCRALRYQASYQKCYLIDSFYNQLPDDPIHQTTGCQRRLGLNSSTEYEVKVAQRCRDPEADSGFTDVVPLEEHPTPTHTTIGRALQPEDVQVLETTGHTIRVSFTPGVDRDYMPLVKNGPRLEMHDGHDCVFKKWGFEAYLNVTEEVPTTGLIDCQQVPYFCEPIWHPVPGWCADDSRATAWCEFRVDWSEELYQVRVREECHDHSADSPYNVPSSWAETVNNTDADPVENLTVDAVRYNVSNVSLTFDWDVGELNDCRFTGWELEMRPRGSPGFPEDANWTLYPICADARLEEVNCTIDEGIVTNTYYDIRVRAYCVDPLAQGNWTEITILTPPIPAEAPYLSLIGSGAFHMDIAFEPKASRDCEFVAWKVWFQEAYIPEEHKDKLPFVDHNTTATTSRTSTTSTTASNTTTSVSITSSTRSLTSSVTSTSTSVPSVTATSTTEPNSTSTFTSTRTTSTSTTSYTSATYTSTSTTTQECVDSPPGWADSGGVTCPQYQQFQLCTVDGGYGAGWVGAWGTFDRFAVDGVNAGYACCVCGGGNQATTTSMTSMTVTNTTTSGTNTATVTTSTSSTRTHSSTTSLTQTATSVTSTSSTSMSTTSTTLHIWEVQTIACTPQTRKGASCVITGLLPNTTYHLEVCETCINSEANACSEGTNMTMLSGPENLTNLTIPTRTRLHATIRFEAPDESWNCESRGWDLEYLDVNSTWQELHTCERKPGSAAVQMCELDMHGFMPNQEYEMRVREICELEFLYGEYFYFTLPEVKEVTIRGSLVVDEDEVNSSTEEVNSSTEEFGVRRLLDSHVLVSVAEALSTVTGLPAERVAVVEAPTDDGERVLQYTLAVGKNADGDATQAEDHSSEVLTRLTSGGSAADNLQPMLGGIVELTDGSAPEVVADSSALAPACGAPMTVALATPGWSASSCAGHAWSDAPCVVPCVDGYWSADSYRCSIAGVWMGSPRCVPKWVTTAWSNCSNSCGAGVESREVICPTGSGCEATQPSDQRACYGFNCAWVVGEWANCTAACGSSLRLRQVFCPSGRDEDCAQLAPRPENASACEDFSTCGWLSGNWSSCSNSCGSGTQARSVRCETGVSSQCQTLAPSTTQICRDVSACFWSVGDWSSCSNSCGAGLQTRNVQCPSGRNEDCPGNKPESSRSCYATEGCSWVPGEWTECDETCGFGKQTLSVSCSSAIASDCGSQPTPAERSCYGSSSCAWLTSKWGACSNQCGQGVRVRSVMCTGSSEADCAGSKPATSEACQDITGCAWEVGEWSNCSTSCGEGYRNRVVSCSSGTAADCASAPHPAQLESCREVSGCHWSISDWSACSTACGSGSRSRSVSCPTGSEADCSGETPSKTEACEDSSGCEWEVSAWSACNVTCGSGYQERSISCPIASSCSGAGPMAVQACVDTSQCSWSVGSWSSCSSSCGDGVRSRTVSCPSGSDKDCPRSQPATWEACSSIQGCGWQVSNWSACSVDCGSGVRTRSVSCPSGVPSDCGSETPPTSEECYGSSNCSWIVGRWAGCSASCGVGVEVRNVSCQGQLESDCSVEKPESSRPCTSTAHCSWEVGAWSDCSSSCGTGTQQRSVRCSSLNGLDEDCYGEAPSTQRQCHEVSKCTWLLSSWGNCSTLCGPGTRSRSLSCSSGVEADCAHLSKPLDQQPCDNSFAGVCSWNVGSWSTCASPGCGLQAIEEREVTCPSVLGDSGCAGERPASSRTCESELVPCAWEVTPWSECSTLCGTGIQVREVSCPGGSHRCAGTLVPDAVRSCESSAACNWEVGAWSNCSTSCGAGVQTRSVTCARKACEDKPPNSTRHCRGIDTCAWTSGVWGKCSVQCGRGLRHREVRCDPTGREEDCAAAALRPADEEVCEDFSSCDWAVSAWSSCSNACGNGTRQRTVRCMSGLELDCLDKGPLPSTVEPCTEADGCAWQTSEWRACSALCGEGVQLRDVWCPSETGCPGSRPASSQACESREGCGWTVGNWSDRSNSCGAGSQVRIVTCTGGSCIDGPVSEQECRGVTGCAWVVGQWGSCSNRCGAGVRERSVSCPDSEAATCGLRPADAELCRETSGCSWQVGEWLPCSSSCEPRSRLVRCPTGLSQDCSSSEPDNTTACDHEACMAPLQDPLVLKLILNLASDEGGSDGSASRIVSSVRAALAAILDADLSAITAEVDSSSVNRRLAEMLSLTIRIQKATQGMVAFLEAGSGRNIVTSGILQELKKEGIPVAGVSLPFESIIAAAASTSTSSSATARSSTADFASSTTTTSVAALQVAHSLGQAASGETAASGGGSAAGVAIAFLVAAGLCGGLAWIVWRARQRRLEALQKRGRGKEQAEELKPWDRLGDCLVDLIWPSSLAKVHVRMEEEELPEPAASSPKKNSKSRSPKDKILSHIAQSPNPGPPSEPCSLSASRGSEGAREVAAAAAEVDTALRLAEAAAQLQATPSECSESTRPPSGSSGESRQAEASARPAEARNRPPVRRMEVPDERRAGGASGLRATASAPSIDTQQAEETRAEGMQSPTPSAVSELPLPPSFPPSPPAASARGAAAINRPSQLAGAPPMPRSKARAQAVPARSVPGSVRRVPALSTVQLPQVPQVPQVPPVREASRGASRAGVAPRTAVAGTAEKHPESPSAIPPVPQRLLSPPPQPPTPKSPMATVVRARSRHREIPATPPQASKESAWSESSRTPREDMTEAPPRSDVKPEGRPVVRAAVVKSQPTSRAVVSAVRRSAVRAAPKSPSATKDWPPPRPG